MGCFDKFLNPQLEHEMELRELLPDGAEKWWCRECGRTELITCRAKPPAVLVEGNFRVHHRYADVSRPRPAPEHHEEKLVKIHPSGVEEWHCTVCSLHYLISRGPTNIMILDIGDEAALHFRAGEPASPCQARQAQTGAQPRAQEPAPAPDPLEPYRRRFAEHL